MPHSGGVWVLLRAARTSRRQGQGAANDILLAGQT